MTQFACLMTWFSERFTFSSTLCARRTVLLFSFSATSAQQFCESELWGINLCVQKTKRHTITETKLSMYGLGDLAVSQRNSSAGTEIVASSPGHHSAAFTTSPSSSSDFLPHSLGSFQFQNKWEGNSIDMGSFPARHFLTSEILICNRNIPV